MIRLALPNSPYIVPETGLPVEGRMKVFLHDSAEYAELSTLQGEEYVQAANPQLLHAGLPFATLFTPLGVFDVVIEQYIGVPGEMSVYSPDSDFEQIGVYRTGMDFDIASFSRNTVDTLDELRDVDPALKMVTVKWYATAGDCVPRTYIWDAASENTEDGGYVIGSDVSDTGKWILMWDDEVLPCSVYGVKPGTEANITLLLSYPALVGSFQLATAPRVRFTRGTYTTNNTWNTTKELLFDPGAKFTEAIFVCPAAEISGNSAYVADFEFTSPTAEAHSSWFRSVTGFWFSGAKRLVIDGTNYFADTVVSGSPVVENAIIEGSNRMAVTYNAGRYIQFRRCAFCATEIFSPSQDFVKFSWAKWQDEIWTTRVASNFDFGSISGGHHVEFFVSDDNSLRLAEFGDADIWLRAIDACLRDTAYSNTIADLEGRRISAFSFTRFTELRNASVAGNIELAGAPTGFAINNVTCDGDVNGGTNPVVTNSRLRWGTEWTGSFNARDSYLLGGNITGTHDITVNGGFWGMNLKDATDNSTDTGTKVFQDVDFSKTSGSHKTKNLFLLGCKVTLQDIEIYPVYDDDSGLFYFNGRIEGCTVYGTKAIHYTMVRGLGDGCKECAFTYSWLNNSFNGNDEGLSIDYWVDPPGQVCMVSRNDNDVLYQGNSGQCPQEKWTGNTTHSWESCTFYTDQGPDSASTSGYKADVGARVCPVFNRVSHVGFCYPVKYAYRIAGDAVGLAFKAATDPGPDKYGDLFDVVFEMISSGGSTTFNYV